MSRISHNRGSTRRHLGTKTDAEIRDWVYLRVCAILDADQVLAERHAASVISPALRAALRTLADLANRRPDRTGPPEVSK